MVSQCFRVLSLWGARPCLCEAGPSNWYTHMFLHHLCPRLSRASICFCYCSIVNWPIVPNPPLSVASFILLEGGLGSSRWRVWWQRCRLAIGGYPSKEKPLPLGPSPLALGPPLPPNCQRIQLPAFVRAQGTAPPPWLPFPIWKPVTPPAGELWVSCERHWFGGKIGVLAACCVESRRGCVCCAIVCYL